MEEIKLNPVSIVTIKNKFELFKGEESAINIELIELEEVGFNLVSQKNLYSIGDQAIFIQPDYNLSDISLFESFIRPNGDESKSMLGKIEGLPRRIRAKKFNFSRVPNGDPVYSNGILLPIREVQSYLNVKDSNDMFDVDFTKELGITKYEAPEDKFPGGLKLGASSQFPEGIYKTDETNIYNQLGRMQFPITLVGTEKIDGSSITIGIRNGEGFICSRNMKKSLSFKKCIGVRKKFVLEKLLFWTKPDLKIYEEVSNDSDDFVKHGKPYLNKLISEGYNNIVLRGELNGGSLKGSGNKNNPAKKESANIKFYTLDHINEVGYTVKESRSELIKLCTQLNFVPVKAVFEQEFNSFEDIITKCDEYFKDNMIEGIVVRTLDSSFSCKVMNLEYDSKK